MASAVPAAGFSTRFSVGQRSPYICAREELVKALCWMGRVIGHVLAQVAVLGIFALDRAARVFTGKEELS